MQLVKVTRIVREEADRILFAGVRIDALGRSLDPLGEVQFHIGQPGAGQVAVALESGKQEVQVELP